MDTRKYLEHSRPSTTRISFFSEHLSGISLISSTACANITGLFGIKADACLQTAHRPLTFGKFPSLSAGKCSLMNPPRGKDDYSFPNQSLNHPRLLPSRLKDQRPAVARPLTHRFFFYLPRSLRFLSLAGAG
uniref:Uncharacterized protein n=1 Tax=Rousettus aegyptiacus TaxID=9407 RepID=A0A7J8HSE8_ROUAE|nr:hypothetical protein HJG63_011101 [Rousettus aegyptiacus]